VSHKSAKVDTLIHGSLLLEYPVASGLLLNLEASFLFGNTLPDLFPKFNEYLTREKNPLYSKYEYKETGNEIYHLELPCCLSVMYIAFFLLHGFSGN
jgi:hypothetical protein